MKLKKRAALLAGMAVLTVAATLCRLEHWMPHQENPLIILLTFASMPISVVLALGQIVEGIRTKRWLWLVVGVLAAAVCLWGALTYQRIPFCLECNGGVTPEELGWMAPWFYPQGSSLDPACAGSAMP